MKTIFILAAIFIQQSIVAFAQSTINNIFSYGGHVLTKSKAEIIIKNQINKHSNTHTSDGGISTLFLYQNNEELFLEISPKQEKKISTPDNKNDINNDEIISVDYYDMNGKLVLNKKTTDINFENFENLPFGIYLYTIRNNQDEIIETGKIIK